MCAHTREQLLTPERLGDEIHCTEPQAFHGRFQLVRRTYKNQRNITSFGARLETATNLESIKARHADVEQDQIRGLCLDRSERQFSCICRTHLIPVGG